MADYRPDVHGLVEGPGDAPYDVVERALKVTCPDCNVNVFIERAGDEWQLTIAHDETCPWLTEREHAGGA